MYVLDYCILFARCLIDFFSVFFFIFFYSMNSSILLEWHTGKKFKNFEILCAKIRFLKVKTK